MAAVAVPVAAALVAVSLLSVMLGSVSDSVGSQAAGAAGAAVRGEVPPGVVGTYQAVAEDERLPWELLASLGAETTGNGLEAPDGMERGFDPSLEDEQLEEMAAAGGADPEAETTSTTSTTAATDTTEAGDSGARGSVVPVADPPIVEEDADGRWVGVFLVDEDAWAEASSTGTYGDDPQVLADQAGVVARLMLRAVTATEEFDPDLSFEENRDPWVEAVASLPIKGLAGGAESESKAGRIVERAISWSKGEDWCSGGSASSGSSALPTGGPMAIGASFIYDPALKLTEDRWQNASTLIRVAFERGLGERGAVVVIAAAIPETGLLNLDYGDRDSLGILQQRPSQGWGTPEQVQDVAYAAGRFFDELVKIDGWEELEPGLAAQRVQRSGHPDRPSRAVQDAVNLVATYTATNGGAATPSGSSTTTSTTTAPAGETTSTTAPADGSPSVPAGSSNVVVVGDSLTEGANGSGRLPQGWTVDAEVGRTTSEGAAVLAELDVGTFDAVVIALGANDHSATAEAYGELIDLAMAPVGTTKPVWWVNVDLGSSELADAGGVNEAISSAVSRHPNLRVGDWNAKVPTIDGFDEMRSDDGIHYTSDGYERYAEFIAGLPSPASAPDPGCSTAGQNAGVVIDIDTGAPISLCPIQDARTNCEVVDEIEAMIAAAAADGTSLVIGNSYRDPAQQIQLRKAHCGTSYFAIYEMSASACRPPTARPGTSQHEKGLAIDFRNCSTRSTACYRWLAANAERFGFYNLPSEAWHWSTTGS